MQNRYVGDVGDFGKFAALRRLAGRGYEADVRLGIVWCLFPDEDHNSDGRHVFYTERADFAGLDDELLAGLRRLVQTGRRSVSAIATSELLPSDTVFCDEIISLNSGRTREQRLSHRKGWLERCLALTAGCDLVFFDPDNGLEVASVERHLPKGGKYICWNELEPFWERDQSLLVYHHLNRTKSASAQISELKVRFECEFAGSQVTPLLFRRGSLRVFWLVCRAGAIATEFNRRVAEFGVGGWVRHFQIS